MEYTAFKQKFNISLNSEQEKAVKEVDGPVLLLAVPGSGKTTALITRLGYMIFGKGISAENILTVTYTVSATKEMAEKIDACDTVSRSRGILYLILTFFGLGIIVYALMQDILNKAY